MSTLDRIAIDLIEPMVPGNRKYPIKAVVGEVIPVHACVWMDGHDTPGARIQATYVPTGDSIITECYSSTPDHFYGTFTPDRPGMWSLNIIGYRDEYATWKRAIEKKLAAGFTADQLENELELGARLFADIDTDIANALRNKDSELSFRVSAALSPEISDYFRTNPKQNFTTESPAYYVYVERPDALYSSWYEFFPRSTGGFDADGKPIHGTFATATAALDRIAAMGFTVVYLPPIHPIGHINRKGPNNSLTSEPGDVGSPWAIGSHLGGHDAIAPELGTTHDFQKFCSRAAELGLEIALDFALQCAPDHPWVSEHPEWFTTLPDGSIAYAENPPKKYQDIYPLNFDNDPEGLYQACYKVLQYWLNLGIRRFRVDNPHTKPQNFWAWLIAKTKNEYPETLFLSEAFTRPARLYGLARRGFSQSYTYFTWKISKYELTEFALELVEHASECRPVLFTNTPDILHHSLHNAPAAMFALRAVLAATLSPSWGIYSGYELYESTPKEPDSEEYLDSEKYQLKPRDYAGALGRGESLEHWIRTINTIRNNHSALQQLRGIHFHTVDNEALIAYSKYDFATSDQVLVIVNLDPHATQEGVIYLDMPALGQQWDGQFEVIDEITGEQYWWKKDNFIRLTPSKSVCHILTLPPYALLS